METLLSVPSAQRTTLHGEKAVVEIANPLDPVQRDSLCTAHASAAPGREIDAKDAPGVRDVRHGIARQREAPEIGFLDSGPQPKRLRGAADLVDASALGMHGFRDLPVRRDLPGHRQATPERCQPTADVRRETAGHHQADAAASALGEIRGELVEVACVVLEAGVHRAHQHAVGQGNEAEVERGEQRRVAHGVYLAIQTIV